jgi:hypothetical protein
MLGMLADKPYWLVHPTGGLGVVEGSETPVVRGVDQGLCRVF